MGTTLFDRAMDNFDGAKKNMAEHNAGRADFYQAKESFYKGEINIAEKMRQEAAAEERTDKGTWGAIGKSLLGAMQVTPYVMLPSLLIVDVMTNRPGSEAKEKKEACAAKEIIEKKEQYKEKLDAVEQQEESAEIMHTARAHVVQPGDSIWKIVANDYSLHHNGEINNKIISERTNALVAIYGEKIHANQKIELPEQP